MKYIPKLDKNFRPMVIEFRNYVAEVKKPIANP